MDLGVIVAIYQVSSGRVPGYLVRQGRGRAVLEAAHYEAVSSGNFGPADPSAKAARPTPMPFRLPS
jgi:hypothetical protein